MLRGAGRGTPVPIDVERGRVVALTLAAGVDGRFGVGMVVGFDAFRRWSVLIGNFVL